MSPPAFRAEQRERRGGVVYLPPIYRAPQEWQDDSVPATIGGPFPSRRKVHASCQAEGSYSFLLSRCIFFSEKKGLNIISLETFFFYIYYSV